MNELIDQLRSIGLRAEREAIEALLKHAQKSRLSHVQTLQQLAEIETREREARNLQSRTREASLGTFKTLDRFDWNHPRSLDRDLYQHLYDSLDFIEHGHNVLFRGQAGVGKTWEVGMTQVCVWRSRERAVLFSHTRILRCNCIRAKFVQTIRHSHI